MILRRGIPFLLLGGFLQAQSPASAPDHELEAAERRLLEQRHQAVRHQLLLYADELQKLHDRLSAAGDATGAAPVRQELDAALAAVQQLTSDGAALPEPKPAPEKDIPKGAAPGPTALQSRRIDALLARFQAAPDGPAADPAPGTAESPGRQKILALKKAALNRPRPGGTGDWSSTGATASWTVADMIPGTYGIILRYSAGEKSGGTAVLTVAGKAFTVTVPPGGRTSRKLELHAGTVSITEPGIDVRLESTALASGAVSLWDLQAVVLQPVEPKRP